VALFVTGHGYGHAVRSAEVARDLLQRGARVLLRTDAPTWLFPEGVEPMPSPGWPVDVGVVQRDGLDLDIEATRARWEALLPEFAGRAEVEAEWLRERGVQVVLGDVPALAFEAAGRAGVPSAAMTNFGWDWIYEPWPGFEAVVAVIRAAYSQADLLLRLPLHSPEDDAFPAFTRIQDVALVARRSTLERAEARRRLAIGNERPMVLLSFGGFDMRRFDLRPLGRWQEYLFVTTPSEQDSPAELPSNVLRLPREQLDYVSLVAASDVVVTKPGYGIAADCLANRARVLYTDRGPFREYDVLAGALERLGPARYVPQAEVRAGDLGPHLEKLLAQPAEWQPLALNGAAEVAEAVLDLAAGKRSPVAGAVAG